MGWVTVALALIRFGIRRLRCVLRVIYHPLGTNYVVLSRTHGWPILLCPRCGTPLLHGVHPLRRVSAAARASDPRMFPRSPLALVALAGETLGSYLLPFPPFRRDQAHSLRDQGFTV